MLDKNGQSKDSIKEQCVPIFHTLDMVGEYHKIVVEHQVLNVVMDWN